MEKTSIPLQLKSHFLRLYQIALSDENFNHMEMQLLYHFAEERGIPKSELDSILTGAIGEVTIPDSIEERIEYLYDFAQMIWADEKITEDEMTAFKKYCKKFEFLDENVEELTTYLLEKAKQGTPKSQILQELN
ncbi:hypothetical protein SAMN04488033_11653 [Salegentibacter agarivorans]|uniref:Tellurite resistance protein TerB n=1 Tax=Salegentibacter agarivorans TaxID=345907 RepID=A0A1I2MVF7_9FLAO|nr:hypothetical protein [Salegentibacter agarivorans]SFF95544.1 hypothetical protein SAMN04488033_11653 [Salegentibacter agarivorans]